MRLRVESVERSPVPGKHMVTLYSPLPLHFNTRGHAHVSRQLLLVPDEARRSLLDEALLALGRSTSGHGEAAAAKQREEGLAAAVMRERIKQRESEAAGGETRERSSSRRSRRSQVEA